MSQIDLAPEEIELLLSALDSAEYWEHKDQLPHNSGYILDPEYMVDAPKMDEEALEAWEEVKRLRAIAERLQQLRVQPCDDCGREDGSHNPEVEH